MVLASFRSDSQVRNLECECNLTDSVAYIKRDFITSDEPYSPIDRAGHAAAGDPAAHGFARVRARRIATEFSPCGARSGAQSVGHQPSNSRTGGAVRRK